jgi:hypothetical protein
MARVGFAHDLLRAIVMLAHVAVGQAAATAMQAVIVAVPRSGRRFHALALLEAITRRLRERIAGRLTAAFNGLRFVSVPHCVELLLPLGGGVVQRYVMVRLAGAVARDVPAVLAALVCRESWRVMDCKSILSGLREETGLRSAIVRRSDRALLRAFDGHAALPVVSSVENKFVAVLADAVALDPIEEFI